MKRIVSRAGRSPLALIAAAVTALGACADEPTAPTMSQPELAPQAAVGQVITVTNRSGGTDVGSLRWAVGQATGGEIIRFDPALAGRTIVLEQPVQAYKYVTIEGDPTYGITVSGGGKTSVMVAVEGMTLRNMNITDGYAFDGAGIMSIGPLTLEHVSVYNNWATAGAAGIFVGTEATLINSTVAFNEGPHAIFYHYTGGKLTLINSTIASQISGYGLLAGGSTASPPVVTLHNSIIAGNGNGTTTFNCRENAGFRYEGMNIASDASCGNAGAIVVANPLLASIGNNGGPSVTMKLHHQSPAIDAGSSCSVTVDQRHVARDALCDVGAYEFTDFNVVTVTIDPTVVLDKGTGSAVVSGTVKCSYADEIGIGLRVQLQQRNRQATSFLSFTCSTTPEPWSARLVPSSGGFTNGPAVATASTNDEPSWYKGDSTSQSVKVAAK
jgi:hypothetical protein